MQKQNHRQNLNDGLDTLLRFFVNTFTSIKLLFTGSKIDLPETNTVNVNIVNIETSGTKEAGNIAGNSANLLILPPNIRHKLFNLVKSQREISPSLVNHRGNHSILALLNINNMYFWGSNNAISALTPRELNDLRVILKYNNTLSAYSPFLIYPEADAILQAFRQKMTADRATMFIERKECNVCGRREFDAKRLRQLMPILSLKELTVYTNNSVGKMSKLVLPPF